MLAAALAQLGQMEKAKEKGSIALALERGFTISGFCKAIGTVPEIEGPLTEGLHKAGLPQLADQSEENLGLNNLKQYLMRSEYFDARRYIRREKLWEKTYNKWNAIDKEAADRVCASYDRAGDDITSGVIDIYGVQIFLINWGESICHQFEALKPFLDDEQAKGKTGRNFWRKFVALYDMSRVYHRNPYLLRFQIGQVE
jgi:hypothetical protein